MAEAKECLQCAEKISLKATYCRHCGSHQNWRRYITISNTMLALLVALISVATPLVAQLKKENSNLSILQLAVQQDDAANISGDPFAGHRLYATIANLGDKPGLIEDIEPMQIDGGLTIDFIVRFADTYHEPGTKRVGIATTFSYDASLNSLARESLLEINAKVEDAFADLPDTIDLNIHVLNFDESKEVLQTGLAKEDLAWLMIADVNRCAELVRTDPPSDSPDLGLIPENQRCAGKIRLMDAELLPES